MRRGERMQARSIQQWAPLLPPARLRHSPRAAATLPEPPGWDGTLGKHPPTSFFPAATSNLSLLSPNHPPPTYKAIAVRNARFPPPSPPHEPALRGWKMPSSQRSGHPRLWLWDPSCLIPFRTTAWKAPLADLLCSFFFFFQLHIIAHVQVGRGYLLPTRFDTPPFLKRAASFPFCSRPPTHLAMRNAAENWPATKPPTWGGGAPAAAAHFSRSQLFKHS